MKIYQIQYTFKISGQLSHKIGSLLPFPGEQPKFSQIYFMDGDQAERRAQIFGGETDVNVFRKLQNIMMDINPYIKIFRQAKELSGQNISIKIFNDPKLDPRIYNNPNVSEVAAIIVDDPTANEGRDIILRTINGPLKRIKSTNQGYNALAYPLLFPRGESGWHVGLSRQCGKKITLMDYNKYYLQVRLEGKIIFNTFRVWFTSSCR